MTPIVRPFGHPIDAERRRLPPSRRSTQIKFAEILNLHPIRVHDRRPTVAYPAIQYGMDMQEAATPIEERWPRGMYDRLVRRRPCVKVRVWVNAIIRITADLVEPELSPVEQPNHLIIEIFSFLDFINGYRRVLQFNNCTSVGIENIRPVRADHPLLPRVGHARLPGSMPSRLGLKERITIGFR